MYSFEVAEVYKEIGHALEQLQQSAYDDGAYNLSIRLAQISALFKERYVEYFGLHVKK